MPGMDPKQMAALMKQMGMKTEEIEAERIIIEKKNGSRLVIENPSATIIEMRGQKMLQASGEFKEGEAKRGEAGGEGGTGEEKEESDVDIIMKETGASREQAEKALAEADGDLAQAIVSLQK